jgi:hypothetical protein
MRFDLRLLLPLALFWLLPVPPLLAAWRHWRRDLAMLPARRRVTWRIALCILTLSMLLYVGFDVHTCLLPEGWFPHLSGYYLWVRSGLLTSFVGLVLALFGKQRGRLWGVVSGVALLAVWLVPALTTP